MLYTDCFGVALISIIWTQLIYVILKILSSGANLYAFKSTHSVCSSLISIFIFIFLLYVQSLGLLVVPSSLEIQLLHLG